MISAVILAAGFSRRMIGMNKLLVTLNGKKIIEYVIDAVINSDFDEVVLVYKDEEVKKIAVKYNVKSVHNNNSKNGQSTSLVCGVKNLSPDSDGCVLILGDMPFIDKVILNKLIYNFNVLKDNHSIIAPFYNGKRGNPVLFGNQYYDEILNLSGDVGAKNIILKYSSKLNAVEVDSTLSNLDIDDSNDFKKAESLLCTNK